MAKINIEEKLAEIKANAEGLAELYNKQMLESKFDDASKTDAEMKKAVDEYAQIQMDDVFMHCRASEDPMYEACRILRYPVIKIKDGTVEGSELKRREIVDAEKQIDLAKLHKFCNGIGHDQKWIYKLEKFNMLLTAQVASNLGIDPKQVHDSYAMNAISKEIDLGKNPTSNTNLLKTLTSIIHDMIGEEYKPISRDVKYLQYIYGKKGKSALTVVCANHRYMRNYVQEICHRLITDKAYTVDYKMTK